MPRFKLTLEYDGRAFQGWQRQKTGISVQEALETAIHAFSGETVTVQGAGRTDAGVHATGQVAHLDLEKPMSLESLQNALNHHLRPHAIAVVRATEVPDDFHARFSATGRRYRYRIINRRPPLVLEAGRAWHLPTMIEAEVMHEAAQRLIGKHDFTSFRSAACQSKSPVKTMDRITVQRIGDEIHITFAARSFLHHQVRNIVGTLKMIGDNKWSVDRIESILEAKNRAAAGPTAPADGLYLTVVDY
ncbi:MAG: tRNA pseudouridine(38-40) synthase TruA [Alphaproteobacteria bacterium]|nr:tRNA pseudouridine(38-40) synthase TruA [Alphaproteobacteria bacterium]